jgi:anti-sigma factor RsiW
MSCHKWQEMIIDRIADELSESDAIILEQHLADCETCQVTYGSFKQLTTAAGRHEEWIPDEAMAARLSAQLNPQVRRPARSAQKVSGGREQSFSFSATMIRWLLLRPVPSYAMMTALVCALRRPLAEELIFVLNRSAR